MLNFKSRPEVDSTLTPTTITTRTTPNHFPLYHVLRLIALFAVFFLYLKIFFLFLIHINLVVEFFHIIPNIKEDNGGSNE
ncbi:MAG TPA: hypothetical protein DHM44_00405 [Flexistipes sinusarabici]|uniref:Uncharacterized protein n=1 Tax=Flexistipes sinusarabici TaxID=2352 RepID=A0A3D5Q8W0_FLESI|nr:hypothetical protein [Flexistipes sinusarabici]